MILSACTLCAQPILILKSSVYSDVDWALRAENRFDVSNSPSADFHWTISNDAIHAKGFTENNKQTLHINTNLRALYSHTDAFRLAASYRNISYGSAEILPLYPSWSSLQYKRRMQHWGGIEGTGSIGALNINASGSIKALYLTPYMIDPADFELKPQSNDTYQDVYANLLLGINVLGSVDVYAGIDYKDALYTDNNEFGISNVMLGSKVRIQASDIGQLLLTAHLTHREGEPVSAEKANLLHSKARYQHRFNPDLSGFITLENNMCVDNEASALYLVSNYARVQLRYNMPWDAESTSYLTGGFKYSPENDANALFADSELRVMGNVYARLGCNVTLDRYQHYTGAMCYRFSSINEIALAYHHREFSSRPGKTDYWGLETKLYW